jgi:hypothetical protein
MRIAIIAATVIVAAPAIAQDMLPEVTARVPKSLETPEWPRTDVPIEPLPETPRPAPAVPVVSFGRGVSNCHAGGCVGVTQDGGNWASMQSTWPGGSSTHTSGPHGEQYSTVCNDAGGCQTW